MKNNEISQIDTSIQIDLESKESECEKCLSSRQLQAIQLLAQGITITQTAKNLGVSRESVSRWKKNPIFIAKMNRLINENYLAGKRRLAALMNKALNVIEADLDSGSVSTAFKVVGMNDLNNFKPCLEDEQDITTVLAIQYAKKIYQEDIKQESGLPNRLYQISDEIYETLMKKYEIPDLHSLEMDCDSSIIGLDYGEGEKGFYKEERQVI